MAAILHAFLEEDGSGILEQDGKFYYIEYPYTDSSVGHCDFEIAHRMIDRVGYRPLGKSFASIAEIVDFLKAKANAYAESHRVEMSDAEYLAQYNALPIEMLNAIVDEFEDHLFEHDYQEPALRGLKRLLSLEAVYADDRLRKRVERLVTFIMNLQSKQSVSSTVSEENQVTLFFGYQKALGRYGGLPLKLIAFSNSQQLRPARV